MAEKKCIYCKTTIPSARAMDICDKCGNSVWGQKMFQTILGTTNEEMAKGNLELYGTNKV